MMSAGAGRGADGPQSATGSSAKIEKSAALTVGALCPRSRSAAATVALNDHQKFAASLSTLCPHAHARGAAEFQRAVRPSCAEQTDRLEPALRLLVDVAISF